jgi:hypothetical protein
MAADSPTASPAADAFVYYPYDPVTGEWGEPVLTDAGGNPLASPPAYVVGEDETGKPVVVLVGADGQPLVDDAGTPLIPPDLPGQEPAAPSSPGIPGEQAPPENVYAYYPQNEDGSWGDPVLVDAEGNPLPSPPPYAVGEDDTGKPVVVLVDDQGQPLIQYGGEPLIPPDYGSETTPSEGEAPAGQAPAEGAPPAGGEAGTTGEGAPAGTAEEPPGPPPAPPTEQPQTPGAESTGAAAPMDEGLSGFGPPAAEPAPAAGEAGEEGEGITLIPPPPPQRLETVGVVGLSVEEIADLSQPAPAGVEAVAVVGLGAAGMADIPATLPTPIPEPAEGAETGGDGEGGVAAIPGTLPDLLVDQGVVAIPVPVLERAGLPGAIGPVGREVADLAAGIADEEEPTPTHVADAGQMADLADQPESLVMDDEEGPVQP